MNKFVKNALIITGAAAATTVAIDLINKEPIGTTAKGMATNAVNGIKGVFSKTGEAVENVTETVAAAAADAAEAVEG